MLESFQKEHVWSEVVLSSFNLSEWILFYLEEYLESQGSLVGGVFCVNNGFRGNINTG
jgi:hypothetical protein